MKPEDCLAWVLVFALVVSGAFPQGATQVAFNKVDYYETVGGKERKRDARLVVDAEAKTLTIADEKRGAPVYASIPYSKITKIVYERSAHRRYKAGILISPWLLLTKGKKHWLTIEFEDVEGHPLGYVYSRMDKGNYQRILAALESGTGIDVEEIIED